LKATILKFANGSNYHPIKYKHLFTFYVTIFSQTLASLHSDSA